MAYKVHKFRVEKHIDDVELEKYLNELNGEIISIIPNIKPKMHPMGATAGYDYLIVVVKI